MRRKVLCLLWLAMFAGGAVAADDQSSAPATQPKASGLSAILGAVSPSQMPSLAGLIQPEKMGLLADNQCIAKDNELHLLSDNEADVDLLSGNTTKILSGIRILSGVTLNVNITIAGDTKKPKAKQGKARHKTRKTKKKTGLESKRR